MELTFHLSHGTSQQQYWLTIPEASVQLCAPDDGRRNRPKHVELFRNNKKYLHIFGYNYKIILTMHGHMNIKSI